MLDRQTIERMLAASGAAPILVALSGGGDSTALLHLLADELGAARLRAIVVDHALRSGSAEDAGKAAGFAEKLGVAADVVKLDWTLGPPASPPASADASSKNAGGPRRRSQQAARRMRYAAVCEAARRLGACVIAVAHSADDQAETVLMRAAAGSGWRGLAGMAAIASAPVWPEGRGVMLARPLLAMRRAGLRTYLRARGADWIEDPANANAAFERVRVRARLAALEASGFDPMRFARLATALRPLADAIDAEASSLIEQAARFHADEIHVDITAWRASTHARQRALGTLIAAAAGAERDPQAAAIARLEARMQVETFRGGSLGGARLRRNGGVVRISRDPGAVLGRAGGGKALSPLNLSVGAELVWDGRLALVAAEPGMSLVPKIAAPVIERDGVTLSLADTVETGALSARWLLEQHTIHHLGPLSTTKDGETINSAATFTAP